MYSTWLSWALRRADYHRRPTTSILAPARRTRDKTRVGLLFDFLPILAFFVTLKFTDVYVATAVAIVATLGAAAYQKVKKGRIEPMMLVSCALMVVFGGLTIAFHDETFVKWKPTVLQWLLAAAFVISRFVGAKPLAQRVFGQVFEAERPIWLRVNDGLTLFFVALGVLNLVVAYNFSIDAWATFKLVGLIGLNFVAAFIAVWYLQKHGKRVEPTAGT